jgi:hypothetical protein
MGFPAAETHKKIFHDIYDVQDVDITEFTEKMGNPHVL